MAEEEIKKMVNLKDVMNTVNPTSKLSVTEWVFNLLVKDLPHILNCQFCRPRWDEIGKHLEEVGENNG